MCDTFISIHVSFALSFISSDYSCLAVMPVPILAVCTSVTGAVMHFWQHVTKPPYSRTFRVSATRKYRSRLHGDAALSTAGSGVLLGAEVLLTSLHGYGYTAAP